MALPIGTPGAELLDTHAYDEDPDAQIGDLFEDADEDESPRMGGETAALRTEDDFRRRAEQVYAEYAGQHRARFKWLRPAVFIDELKSDLLADARSLIAVLASCGEWDAGADRKLAALLDLTRRWSASRTQRAGWS